MVVRRAVSGRPEGKASRQLAAGRMSTTDGPGPHRGGVGAHGYGDGDEEEGRGHHMGQEPGRAQHGRIPGHRAEAVEERAQQRRRPARRHAQQHVPAEHHVERAEHRRHRRAIGAQAPHGHEGHEHHRRQGRERDLGAVGGHRQHILEVAVLVGPLDDRVLDLRAALEKGVGLPHEVVVEVVADRVGGEIDDERETEECHRDPHRVDPPQERLQPSAGTGLEGRCFRRGVGEHARAKLPYRAQRGCSRGPLIYSAPLPRFPRRQDVVGDFYPGGWGRP